MYIIYIFGSLEDVVFPYGVFYSSSVCVCVCLLSACVEALMATFSALHNMCKPPKMSPIFNPLMNGMKVPVSLHF